MKVARILYVVFAFVILGGCNTTESNEINVPPDKKTSTFNPVGIPPGSESDYDILLKMSEQELFTVDASITVKNTSPDMWKDLTFYFIPNMFTEINSPQLQKPSTVVIETIKLNGINTDFKLDKDHLSVKLNENLAPSATVIVDVKYQFTLPEQGLRFTKNKENYYLAQWYPMLATYRNGSWNKEDYRFKGETYHTSFSNFKLRYDLPKGLTIITTSDEDSYPSKSFGILEAINVKEFFVALLKEHTVVQKEIGDINVRVFGVDDRTDLHEEILETAIEALSYFQENIGPYPHKQLDIILDELGMEYPGIVTAGSVYNSGPLKSESLKSQVVHEIAHQWFYGIISNDPYHDAWLDEGFTEFATWLFYSEYKDLDFNFELSVERSKELPLPVNLSLNEYPLGTQSSYIYGKASSMLGMIFQANGGKDNAENFFKSYFNYYQYKEIDTSEFTRFMKHFLELGDNTIFENWLQQETTSKPTK